jgi:hypothetical protein
VSLFEVVLICACLVLYGRLRDERARTQRFKDRAARYEKACLSAETALEVLASMGGAEVFTTDEVLQRHFGVDNESRLG